MLPLHRRLRVGPMLEDRSAHLGRLLAAVEDAAPIEVVDSLAAELAGMVDATEVSLLIANFTGSAVVRLSHVTGGDELRDGHNERTESLPLENSTYQRVLFTQQLEVVENDGHVLVLMPVTERGDAIGILELSLPRRPGRRDPGLPLRRRARPVVRPRRLETSHRSLRVGTTRHPLLPGRRDPETPAPLRVHGRMRIVHDRRVARTRPRCRRRHLRLLDRPRAPLHLDHRRCGPLDAGGPPRHDRRQQSPQHPAGAGLPRRTGHSGQRGTPRPTPARTNTSPAR
jgi:hypothetical protein